MVHDLKVFEFTCVMTEVLPSTQKTWKVITPDVGGFDADGLHKMVMAGQPFGVVGRISNVEKGKTLFTSTYLEEVDGIIYILLYGEYLRVSDFDTATPAWHDVRIYLQYDPVLHILKGRRP